MEGQKPKLQPKNKRWFLENVISLALALLGVLTFRSSVIEAFKIPSGSMIPTLLIGDHIFVNKMAYGFKIPFSDLIGHDPIYLIKREPPKRGDIIVFLYPKDESFYYIKRVIGVPGDTIEIHNKSLFINGQVVSRDLINGQAADELFKKLEDPKYTAANLDLYTEHLDQVDHRVLFDKTGFLGESQGPIRVPAHSLFVMGDNRDFSNDSRFWGFVPMENVKGKALVIWLSLSINLSEGQITFRPTRTGTVLH